VGDWVEMPQLTLTGDVLIDIALSLPVKGPAIGLTPSQHPNFKKFMTETRSRTGAHCRNPAGARIMRRHSCWDQQTVHFLDAESVALAALCLTAGII